MSASAEALDPGAAKREIVEFASRGGAVVCGVADADAFGKAPEGFRPGDLLEGARAVVVIGGSQPRAADW